MAYWQKTEMGRPCGSSSANQTQVTGQVTGAEKKQTMLCMV